MATPLTATPIPAYTAIPDVPADLTSALNNLEKFVVTRWATPTARDTAITVPVAGMLAYTTTPDTMWRYNGSAWVDLLERVNAAAMTSQLVSQSLTNATFGAVTMTGETYKSHAALHSTSSNTSRIIIGTVPGVWQISANITFAGTSATGSRRAIMNFNGANTNAYGSVQAGPTTGSNPFTTVVLPPFLVTATTSTDYIEVSAYQDSTAALSTQVGGGAASTVTAVRLGA